MASRVLSLWFPFFETDRIRREKAGGAEAAFATFARIDGAHRLAALCPFAERAGAERGMDLEKARDLVPSLALSPADRKEDGKLLETLQRWCERYTPWVAIDRSHEQQEGAALWLDIDRAAHVFGGEASLLEDLLQQLRAKGLNARAAIADHPGAAWAMARFGGDDQRILPVNGARLALATLPVEALRLDDQQVEALKADGIERIEPLYALPRRVLDARFGRDVVRRLEQALGLIDEPIAPTAPLPAQQAQLIFADPIMTSEALRPSIKRLVRQLSVGLEAAGLGVRRLSLALYRVDKSTAMLSVGTGHPSRDVKRLSRLLIAEAKAVDPGFGIERAILDAVEIEPLLPETIAWRGLGTDGADPFRDLAFGQNRRTPPPLRAVGGGGRTSRVNPMPAIVGNLATAFDLSAEPLEDAVVEPVLAAEEVKPLRLLRQPEPIEAIAPLPEEPPILFRWRQNLHKIVRAQGPERIAPEWWRIPDQEQPSIGHGLMSHIEEERRMRDYFAVEDSAGERFWLFREGLYRSSGAALPRWYLHGLFG